MDKIKKGLGRGLSSLIGETKALVATQTVLEKYQPFYDCSLRLRKDIKFYAIDESCLMRDFPESNFDISSAIFSRVNTSHLYPK